jgi:hypothetical protein
MKNLFFTTFLLIASIITFGQKHVLPEPANWGTETFPFPVEFAKGIPFTGYEELRFTPGWGDTTSVEHWSYCFLWWIDDSAQLDRSKLTSYLEEYYNGLVSRNIESRKIPASKVIPTRAIVKENSNPSNPFTASVNMLNYMAQKPITLNINVNAVHCTASKKKGVFISVSPQPMNHPIWGKFAEIWKGFKCGE